MAGFFYGFGNSLIHLALFVAANFVDRPNIERAMALDQAYFKELEDMLVISGPLKKGIPKAFKWQLDKFQKFE